MYTNPKKIYKLNILRKKKKYNKNKNAPFPEKKYCTSKYNNKNNSNKNKNKMQRSIKCVYSCISNYSQKSLKHSK